LLGRVASLFYPQKNAKIHTFHGNVFEDYFSNKKNHSIIFVERLLARITTKIIAISNTQKHSLIHKYRACKEDKVVIINLGFDLEKFTINKIDKRRTFRNQLELKDDIVLITIIGRVVSIKNHKLFVEIFDYCRKKTNKSIKALVVGDGYELHNIINDCHKLGLKTNYKTIDNSKLDIHFCSWRLDIDTILSASDILCLTSINEGTPVSIIESMASCTASISTNVGGISDIIDHQINGLVVDNNINKYGDNLIMLINDKKYRTELAKKGQQRVLNKYNYTTLIDNIDNLYESIY
jgi:glycosyltransferase involved in cell wall biosynthesis